MEYDFTLEDALAFNEYHFRRSPAGRRARLRHMFLPPAIWMGLALGFEAFVGGDTNHSFAVALAAVSAMWILTAPLFLARQIRRSVQRMYGEGRNRALFGRHVMTVSSEGVTDEGPGTRTQTRWESVERIARSMDHLFIYLNAVAAHVVPARAFRDRGEFERFVESVRELAASAAVGDARGDH
ncbi:MAG: YcxB family protein [Armatimonadota bacterium]